MTINNLFLDNINRIRASFRTLDMEYKDKRENNSLIETSIEFFSNNKIQYQFKKNLLINNLGDMSNEKLSHMLYPMYLLFKKFGGFRLGSIKKKRFKVGVSIPKHPKSMFDMNYLTDLILIDDLELPKNQVVFLDENGDKNIEGYESNNYNYVRVHDKKVKFTFSFFFNVVIKRFLPLYLKFLFVTFLKERDFIESKRRILQDYIIWELFYLEYDIDKYIKRLLPDSVSKTLIMEQHNTKTFFLFLDSSTVDAHVQNQSLPNQTLFSFMNYDYAFISGEHQKRFFMKHQNDIGEYIATGVVFSQLIHEIRSKRLSSCFNRVSVGNRVVGVFDTTYNDNAPLNYEDGVRFAEDILNLLDVFNDVYIIFKSIKEKNFYPQIQPIYDRLETHPRCEVYYMWNEKGISACEIIAKSDLVISASYTSPTIEALYGGIKSIYHNPNEAYNNLNSYYNTFPNFVSHNQMELSNLVRFWLYEATVNDFNAIIKYGKKDFQPHPLPNGLSRIRKDLEEMHLI